MPIIQSNAPQSKQVLSAFLTKNSYTTPILNQFERHDFEISLQALQAIIVSIQAKNNKDCQIRIYNSPEKRTNDNRGYDFPTSQLRYNLANGLVAEIELLYGLSPISIVYESLTLEPKIYCSIFNLGTASVIDLELNCLIIDNPRNKIIELDSSDNLRTLAQNHTYFISSNTPISIYLPEYENVDIGDTIEIIDESGSSSTILPEGLITEEHKLYTFIFGPNQNWVRCH